MIEYITRKRMQQLNFKIILFENPKVLYSLSLKKKLKKTDIKLKTVIQTVRWTYEIEKDWFLLWAFVTHIITWSKNYYYYMK